MPRKPRLDIPGHLYHVIARGNERRPIFLGRGDYEDFLRRLRPALATAGAKCLAWCLMPNHFHLLILRGAGALSGIMRHLMTGYAVGFNLKHGRCGHLFQNRYKAILCDEDEYLRGLIAYIHLNPLRAGLIKMAAGLSSHPWCGHGAITGENTPDFLDREYALSYFGEKEAAAVTRYLAFLGECYAKQKTGEYSGGGLFKRLGWSHNAPTLGKPEPEPFDDRILGGGEFVESVLREADQADAGIPSKTEIVERIFKDFSVGFAEILSSSRERRVSAARAVYCYLARERCRLSGRDILKELRLSSGGLSRLVARGKTIFMAEANK